MKANRLNPPLSPAQTPKWRYLAATGLLAVIVICVWHWTGDRHEPVAHARDAVSPQVAVAAPISPFARAPSAPSKPAPSEPSAPDESLADYSSEKYGFLLSNLFQQTVPTDTLRDSLVKREQLAVALNTSRQAIDPATREKIPEQEQALARVDDQIRSQLHPTDHAVFEVLKDSDVEQFQLNDYADGIANVAPLSEEDRRAILLTKLNYKRYFRQILEDSGILRSDMSPTDRQYAYASVSRALEEYRNSYLQEVRQYLTNEEQYDLLNNYETTEFTAELAKLRSMTGG